MSTRSIKYLKQLSRLFAFIVIASRSPVMIILWTGVIAQSQWIYNYYRDEINYYPLGSMATPRRAENLNRKDQSSPHVAGD